MTNPTAGFGFRATRRIDGAALTLQLEERQIAYNDGTVIGQGDVVKLLNTGYITLFANGDSNALCYGIFEGCSYLDPNSGHTVWSNCWNKPTLASTTVVTARIHLADPKIVYEARCVSGTVAASLTNLDNNVDVVVGTPTVPPGMSVAGVDLANINTTSTFPFRIIGFGQGVDNDNTLKNNIVEVVFNGNALLTATSIG